MGHNYASDNRKKRLKRKKKEMSRIQAWADRSNPDVCVKCGEDSTYDVPYILCEKCWAIWWVTGMKPKSKDKKQMVQDMLKEMNAARFKEALGEEGIKALLKVDI